MSRVLIADDHVAVRSAHRRVLQRMGHTVEETCTTAATVLACQQLKPVLVLLDLQLPAAGGIEVLRQTKGRVIVVTAYDTHAHAAMAFREGACGFISKSSSINTLRDGVTSVLSGERFVDPHLTQYEEHQLLCGLSRRERQVLELLAQGYSNAQIATEFGISVRTVENHRHRLMKKLGLANNASLALFAYRNGVVSLFS